MERPILLFLKNIKLVACCITMGACAPLDLLESDNKRISELHMGRDYVAKPNPRDGDLHMANGYASLRQSKIAPSGFYFARSAFERAAIIKVDDPIPEYLTGYSLFELGQYKDASRSFVSASLLDRTADGWWLASLSALRAGHEIAAQSLYEQGKRANPGLSVELKLFMEELYGSSRQPNDIIIDNTLSSINAFECNDVSDEIENVEKLCASDLEIELYIVERVIDAGSIVGKNLLEDLSVDIYGSRKVIESSSSTGGSNSSTGGSNSSANSTAISNSISLDIPSLNYDLSLASDHETSDTVTATPKLRVRLNEPSTMVSGEKTIIVSAGSSGADLTRGVETQSGINISVSLGRFTESGGQIIASVEISDTSELSVTDGYARLTNNSSNLDTAGEVFYNTAFVLGSLDYREDILTNSGEKALRNLPVLGGLFGQSQSKNVRKELAVLGVLRQPAKIITNDEAQFLSQLGERGIASASRARRQPIVHTMPPFKDFILELGLLDPLKEQAN